MATLLLVRHGETDWNRERRFQGQYDVPLSETGQAQARALAERLAQEMLRGAPIDAIYSSDLSRAMQTASAVSRALGLPVASDDRWREINGGAWEGLLPDEIQDRYPEERQAWYEDPVHICCPGGESFFGVQQRAGNAASELAQRHRDQRVLVVTHGGVIKSLIGWAAGQTDWWRTLTVDNASLTVLMAADDRWQVHRVNDTAHLGGPL